MAVLQPSLTGLESEAELVIVPPQGGYVAMKCSKLASNDNDVNYDDDLKVADGPAVAARKASGIAFETKMGLAWADTLGERIAVIATCDRSVASKKAREAATMALLANPGTAEVIFNARLPADLKASRISEPDFLIRLGDAPRANGRWAWAPGDFKEAKALEGAAKAQAWLVSAMDKPTLEAGVATYLGVGKPKLKHSLQLAHYRRVLEYHGYAADTFGGPCYAAIIGKEGVLVWRDLDAEDHLHVGLDGDRRRKSAQQIYDEEFALRIEVIRRALQRAYDPDLPALVGPEWKAECLECPWKDVCHDELKLDMDHITLLPGVTPTRAKPYYDLGISTVAALARLDHRSGVAVDAGLDVGALITAAKASRDTTAPLSSLLPPVTAKLVVAIKALSDAGVRTVADVRKLDRTTAAFSGSKVWNLAGTIDQARVVKAGKVYLARGVAKVSLTRSWIEEDVDIEDCDGLVYMIGVRTTGREKRKGELKIRVDEHSFADWTHTLAGEARIFAEFWSHIVKMRDKAKRKSYRAYHYTDHENTAFRRLAEKHAGFPGVPSAKELEEFLTSNAWVDMHAVVSKELVWPTENATLKTIAGWARFTWRDSDPGGANSMAWYAEAVNNADAKMRDAYRERLTAYNDDDCEAQIAIRDWLTRLDEAHDSAKKLPNVGALDTRFRRRSRS